MNLRLWIFFGYCLVISSSCHRYWSDQFVTYSEICFHFHIDTKIETFSSRRQRIYFLILFTILILLLCDQKMFALPFIHLETIVVSLVVQNMIRVGGPWILENHIFYFYGREFNIQYLYIIISVFCIPIFFTSSIHRL